MTDWIHCNKCFLRYQRNFKFYLTTCGHVKCEKCISIQGPEKQCLVCKSTCEVVQLSNNLSPDIQSFFKPYNESSQNQKQVFTFQYDNAVSLLRNISTKYNNGKEEIKKQYQMMNEMKKENAKLEMMLTSATKGFATSTPAGRMPNIPMTNIPNIGMPSVTAFRTSNSSRPRPWNQRGQHLQTQEQKQPSQVNSAASNSGPIFRTPQSTNSIKSARSEMEVNTPKNPALIPLSHLQFRFNNNR